MSDIEILLVEDNDFDAELTTRALRRANLLNPVRRLHDGAEALDYLFQGKATAENNAGPFRAVILLDLKLPKVDGIEVLRRVKADPALRMIPVVVLTSSKEDRDVVESYRLGVNSYVVKPVDFREFADAIASLGLYWLILNQPPSA